MDGNEKVSTSASASVSLNFVHGRKTETEIERETQFSLLDDKEKKEETKKKDINGVDDSLLGGKQPALTEYTVLDTEWSI